MQRPLDQYCPTPASAMENETISISRIVMLMDIGGILVRVISGAMIPICGSKMNSVHAYGGYRHNR